MKKQYFWPESKSAKLMKKTLSIGLVTFLTNTALIAQEPVTPAAVPPPVQVQTTPAPVTEPSLRLGIAASPVLSWFSPDGDPNRISGNGVRFSANYGLSMAFRLGANPNYFFSTGLFLMHTGGTLNHDFATVFPNETALSLSERETFFRLNYLNVPLTFLMSTNEVGYIKYFARVGFDLGFNIKANADIIDNNPVSNVSIALNQEDVGDNINLFRTALHIELGFRYNFTGNTDLSISAEWNNGLNNVFSKDYRLPTTDANGVTSLTGSRIKSVTNVVALNVIVYF